MLIVDGHEDIAYNILTWGRDYTRSAQVTRQMEREADWRDERRECTLGWPEWLAGQVAVICATLFVRPARPTSPPGRLLYSTPQEAHRQAIQQLDVYHRLADEHAFFRLVTTARDLDEILAGWQQPRREDAPDPRQIGWVLSMEGADPILEPEQVEWWYERGLRIVGLAWAATRYAGGAHEPGPLTDEGKRLLRVMASFRMGLDLSHCAEQAFFQAVDLYEGPLLASHANPRKFVNSDRHLSDRMIERLAEREGVIGIAPINSMLKQDWRRGDRKDAVTLTDVVAAIDYVCQLVGDARHVALGTDFDGGFGAQDVPAELDTIADLGKIGTALLDYGYASPDVEAILSGNWLRLLKQILSFGLWTRSINSVNAESALAL